MWKSKRELIDGNRIHKISIFTGDKQITYSQVIELWQHDSSFRLFFISLYGCNDMKYFKNATKE